MTLRNMPRRLNNPRPEEFVDDNSTGNQFRDGYARLGRADRLTGRMEPPGPSPAYDFHYRFTLED